MDTGSPDRNNTPQPSPTVRFNDSLHSPRAADMSFGPLPPSGRFIDTTPKISDSFDSNYRLSSMMYKRRPPTPTRRRFELGELDHSETSANARSSRFNPEVEREEVALKDELLRIFHREKDAMEQHYLSKIQELLRNFKSKKEEWELVVKDEREDLEKQFEQERSDMHQSFAQEIAKMTRNFQEEKVEIERKYENKLRDRDMEFDREKRDLNESLKNQLDILKRQLAAENEANLNIELKNESERHNREIEEWRNKINSIKREYDEKLEREKERFEKKYENDVSSVENKFQKQIFNTEKKFEEEKLRLQKKFDEEKLTSDKEWQRRIENLESALRRETNLRIESEKISASEKTNFQALNDMLRDEISRLKEEIDRLRKQPPPQPEVKIIEKPVPVEQPEKPYHTRSDLPLRLREDFDRIVNEYKENLKEKFKRDRTALEEKLEHERERLKQQIEKEKEELGRRLNEEKIRMERDVDRSRDDIEKEIERRLRTKQLSESLAAQQLRFDEVTRRIEEEERKRIEKLVDNDNKKLESVINDLSQENKGLKAKVDVLEDNNRVLKNLKEEGQHEVERLRKAVEELKQVVELRKENEKPRDTSFNTTANDCAPFLMTMMQNQQRPADESEAVKAHMDALILERKRLESLRQDIETKERDLREKKNVEDAAKLAADKSQEKYENLVLEKKRLEETLKVLETRVANMQDEFTRIKQENKCAPLYPTNPHMMPQPPVFVQATPLNVSLNDKAESDSGNICSPGPQAVPTPLPYSFYPPAQTVVYSNNDQKEKIERLKTTKERLTQQLEELQRELKQANIENNLLQKQCHEYERQIDRLNEALEREKDLADDLKKLAEDEKMQNDRLKHDLDIEAEKLHKAQREMSDMRTKLTNEINDLQDKLHHAGKTIVAVREQAAEEINNAVSLMTNNSPRDKPQTLLTTRPPTPSSVYAAQAAKRRLSLTRNEQISPSFEAKGEPPSTIPKELPRALDLVKIKSLEEDKYKLQQQLNETKGVLDNFAGKINSKIDNLESRYESSKAQSRDLSEENRNLNEALAAMELEQTNQAKQNFQLRQQKEHLQKLIERLTNIHPAQAQPTPNFRHIPSARSGSEFSSKDYQPSRRDFPPSSF